MMYMIVFKVVAAPWIDRTGWCPNLILAKWTHLNREGSHRMMNIRRRACSRESLMSVLIEQSNLGVNMSLKVWDWLLGSDVSFCAWQRERSVGLFFFGVSGRFAM